MISCMISMIQALISYRFQGNFISGAIRSRNTKGRFRSNIRMRSPVRCFPVWPSTYITTQHPFPFRISAALESKMLPPRHALI